MTGQSRSTHRNRARIGTSLLSAAGRAVNSPKEFRNKVASEQSLLRRFYDAQCNPTYSILDDYKWLNLKDIRQPRGMPLTTKTPTPYSNIPTSSGLPILNGKPKIAVGLKSNPPLDAYMHGACKMISPRAKHLLETIDGEAFEFLEADTVTAGGKPIENYWLAAVKRVVIEFDVENSEVVSLPLGGPNGDEPNSNFQAIYNFQAPDLPADTHAFLISRFPIQGMIWDDALVDAWIANGFTGLEFTPLQEPSDEEFAQSGRWSSLHRQYWRRKRGLIK